MQKSVYSGIILRTFNIILRDVGGSQLGYKGCCSLLTQMGE